MPADKLPLPPLPAFKPGYYRHAGGGLYEYLDCCYRVDDGDGPTVPEVRYKSVRGPNAGAVFTRTVDRWRERFTPERAIAGQRRVGIAPVEGVVVTVVKADDGDVIFDYESGERKNLLPGLFLGIFPYLEGQADG
ncbi:hypothetical protein [Alienimonas sp. DA493]|uniref:hypothetical protein n=1 Tax=Alienimonas sp. DA493 TaxID=3373605 RepID=UPI0037545826